MLFWLVAAPALPGLVADYQLRTWTQHDGLPNNDITALVLTDDGYLLIATTDGIVRFDGNRFTRQTLVVETPPESATKAGASGALARGDLLPLPDGSRLVRIVNNQAIPVRLPDELSGRKVLVVHKENAQSWWVGLSGGAVLRLEGTRETRFDLSEGQLDPEMMGFASDESGRVWATNGNRLHRFEGDRFEHVPVGIGTEQLRIASARKAGPWVLADEHLLKHRAGEFDQVDKVNSSMAAFYNRALLEDSRGEIWLGSRSRGLRRRDQNSEEWSVVQDPTFITALVEDDFGDIWVGSKGGGLIRVSPGVLGIVNRRTAGMMENHSLAACEDRDGRFWFANRDGGITWLNDRQRASPLPKINRWERFSARSVAAAPDEGIWASTTHGLLRVVDDEYVAIYDHETLMGRQAPDVLHCAANGDLWGANRVLPGITLVQDGFVFALGPEHGVGDGLVRAIAEDESGRIWIGGDDGRLRRFDGKAFSVVHDFTDLDVGAIQMIQFEGRGVCWVGTKRGGLLRLEGGRIRQLTTVNGLSSDNITQILIDDRSLWFGSPVGIFMFIRSDMDRLVSGASEHIRPMILGKDEGVDESACADGHQPSVGMLKNGLIWFAARVGTIVIDPEKVLRTATFLRTDIKEVRVDGQARATPGSQLHLTTGDSVVEIAFTALSLPTPTHVRTRYRLNGFDDDWIMDDSRGIARYVKLPPGQYQLEVKSRLGGHSGVRSAAALDVVVDPAWWQRPWFIVLVFLAVSGGLVFLGRRWSHRRLQRRVVHLEQESLIERERTRIAQNIHDDLGAGLTRISLLTQTMSPQDPNDSLQRIHAATGDLIQSMEEIVWAVNPKNDNLENVASYIGEFAQSFLSDVGLRCRVQIPSQLPECVLSTQFRHHLFLSCKEALNNVVKHACATSVTLKFSADGEYLTVTISDDGVGMDHADASPSGRHNGLENLRCRMADIGGTFAVVPLQPSGTRVILTASLFHPRSTP